MTSICFPFVLNILFLNMNDANLTVFIMCLIIGALPNFQTFFFSLCCENLFSVTHRHWPENYALEFILWIKWFTFSLLHTANVINITHLQLSKQKSERTVAVFSSRKWEEGECAMRFLASLLMCQQRNCFVYRYESPTRILSTREKKNQQESTNKYLLF